MEPTLDIIHQESVARENFILNGENKDLHLVVKNIPFTIRVAASNLDLRKCQLSAKLYYDFQGNSSLREVETLKVSPLEFICHLDPSGMTVDFELKISVLSSAHEGSFFRVKLSALDPDMGIPVECHSAPLRIMSKKSQVMRRVEKKNIVKQEHSEPAVSKKRRLNNGSPHDELHTFDSSAPLNIPNSEILHNFSNNILQLTEAMNRMQQTQLDQAILLKKLMAQGPSTGLSTGSNSSPVHYISTPSSSPSMPLLELSSSAPVPSSPAEDVDQALNLFLNAVQKLSPTDRKRKLHQAFDNLSSEKRSTFSQVIDSYSAQGHYSLCQNNCPHKQQLDSLELFYSEIMREPILDNSNSTLPSHFSLAQINT